MIYGILIGLLVSSVFIFFINGDEQEEELPVNITRQVIRILCLFIFMPSLGGLTALLLESI